VTGQRPDQPETALLEGAARERARPRAAQAVRAGLVALLQRARRLLWSESIWWQCAAARRVRGRAQRRVEASQDLLDRRHLAAQRLPRAFERGLDLRVGLARPAR